MIADRNAMTWIVFPNRGSEEREHHTGIIILTETHVITKDATSALFVLFIKELNALSLIVTKPLIDGGVDLYAT